MFHKFMFSENQIEDFYNGFISYLTMKSKPMGALFGVLALVAITAIAPSAFAATVEVTTAKGADGGSTADCVAANNCFDPSTVTVAPGDTVHWAFPYAGHTVTSGKATDNQTGTVFDSGLVKKGGDYSFTFQNEGTYDYFCMVHPWMAGQVIVSASASTPPTTPPTTNETSGNNTVPEFGSIAPIVLAIAVISIVVFTARNRGIPKL